MNKEIMISYIKSHEPPAVDVYMVQKDHPFWSKYGYMIYGVGDRWEWSCDFNKLEISELGKIFNLLRSS